MWKELFIWLNYNINIDIQFSTEYIIFGTDYDFATVEIIFIMRSTIYTCLQKGKLISFEGTKAYIF